MQAYDRERIAYFGQMTAKLTREEIRDGCIYAVAKCLLNDKHADAHIEFLMRFLDFHAMDWTSSIRTNKISTKSNAYVRLRELEKGSLVKKRSSGAYHFRDGLNPLHAAFSRADATLIEDRNFREFRRHMIENRRVRQRALEISRASSPEELMNLLINNDKYHELYNKIITELQKEHLADKNYAYGEMGWRRNSNYWYLSPTAIKLLSDFLA